MGYPIMIAAALALAVRCASAQPKVLTANGKIVFQDVDVLTGIELGTIASTANRVASVSGQVLMTSNVGAISLGKFNESDAPEIRLAVTGCSSAQKYSLAMTMAQSSTGVSARVTASSPVTSDEAVDQTFATFVTAFAVNTIDSGLGLRVDIDFTHISNGCTSFGYTAAVSSITGGWDSSFDASAASNEVAIIMMATEDFVTSSMASAVDGAVASLQPVVDSLRNESATLRAELDTITANYEALRRVVANLTGCSARGQILAADGSCVDGTPTCDTNPPNLPVGMSLVYSGEAVPGVTARIDCPVGRYDNSGGTTCLRNGTWTTIAPNCVRCDSRCLDCHDRLTCSTCDPNSNFPILRHGMCQESHDGLSASSPFDHCSESKLLGLPSGQYYVNSTRGRVYQTFCLNEPLSGWADVYGGGWEILHTQIGGHGLPNRPISNVNLRARPNVRTGLTPPDLANRTTHRSLLHQAWAERTSDRNMQWIKFMAKFQGNTLRGQDTNLMTFQSTNSLGWLYAASGNGRRGCHQMPGAVELSINGLYMGSTTRAIFFPTGNGRYQSIGLANRDNDRCGQSSTNYLTTNGRTSWRRIDGGTTDNSIRHLFTYADQSTGTSSSRCTYCCWGCGGWREIVMWAARPNPDHS